MENYKFAQGNKLWYLRKSFHNPNYGHFFFRMFCSVCGAANIVTASLFCGSRGARYSSAAGPSTSYVSGSNSLTFEEFVKQRANAGDQTFFNCAVKKAEKEKQVEKKLGGKKKTKGRDQLVQV